MYLGIESSLLRSDVVRCCDCSASSANWIRSVKRKHDEFANEKRFYIPEIELDLSSSNAKVEIENECELLRETVRNQRNSIQELYEELDEERNAASTAANEAMSMILRLQREKADIEMEFRQFKRFVDEKMEHDQQELLDLEDLIYQKEHTIRALTCEAQGYKHRMMSYGITEAEVERDNDNNNGLSRSPSVIDNDFQYPSLKCDLNENPDSLRDDIDVDDVEKYTLGDSSRGREERVKSLEQSISQMEKTPSFTPQSNGDVSEKFSVGQSPKRQRHFIKVSTGSSSPTREQSPDLPCDSSVSKSGRFKRPESASYAKGKGDSSGIGDNDTNDRVYTIDSVHHDVSHSGGDVADESPKEKLKHPDLTDSSDMTKLHARLQALEADRESMRQAIMSMRTEKAQMVLLKEIAQHLSKDTVPEWRLPLRKKTSIVGVLNFISFFEWITSFVFFRTKTRPSKYMNGNNLGLQMLLDRTPRIRQWRCLSCTQV